MTPPAKIQVGHVTYTVTEAKRQNENLAECDQRGQVIVLHSEQGADQRRDSLLHEVLHAIADQTPLRNRHQDDEEEIISALSSLLLDTLRRNPGLVKYLTL